jgi:hypothetical protein
MGRWDKKEILFGDDRLNLPSGQELDQLKRLNDRALIDIDNYDKLGGDGEFERLNSTREFLKHPKEMRKYLRKKKSTKPKQKRCRCKK